MSIGDRTAFRLWDMGYWAIRRWGIGYRIAIKKSQKKKFSAVFCCKCQKNVVILQRQVIHNRLMLS